MAKGYVYLVVKPHSSAHPMDMIIGVGNYLYEAKYIISQQKILPSLVEIWRMRAGKIEKKEVEGWRDGDQNE